MDACTTVSPFQRLGTLAHIVAAVLAALVVTWSALLAFGFSVGAAIYSSDDVSPSLVPAVALLFLAIFSIPLIPAGFLLRGVLSRRPMMIWFSAAIFLLSIGMPALSGLAYVPAHYCAILAAALAMFDPKLIPGRGSRHLTWFAVALGTLAVSVAGAATFGTWLIVFREDPFWLFTLPYALAPVGLALCGVVYLSARDLNVSIAAGFALVAIGLIGSAAEPSIGFTLIFSGVTLIAAALVASTATLDDPPPSAVH